MKRYISYIYHYAEGTHKCGNVGFCKVEENSEHFGITLCIKDVCPIDGKCIIYNLKRNKNQTEKTKKYTKSKIDKSLYISGGKLNEKLNLEGGDGVLICCGTRMYVALWKSLEETICIVEEETPKQETSKQHTYIEPPKTEHINKKPLKYTEKQGNLEYEKLYNRLCKSRMILDDMEYQVVKLKPQDFMWFPRCHWRLINNCFVMDGYYRYGHILFLKYKDNYIIAVPSIETEKTPEVAKRFGFPYSIYGSDYGKEDIKRPYWFKTL